MGRQARGGAGGWTGRGAGGGAAGLLAVERPVGRRVARPLTALRVLGEGLGWRPQISSPNFIKNKQNRFLFFNRKHIKQNKTHFSCIIRPCASVCRPRRRRSRRGSALARRPAAWRACCPPCPGTRAASGRSAGRGAAAPPAAPRAPGRPPPPSAPAAACASARTYVGKIGAL